MDNDDRGLAAMPKLVGGPTYSRPPVVAPRTELPPDPDDLPLKSEWTPEDQDLAAQLGLDDGSAASGTATAPVVEPGRASTGPNATWSPGSGTAVEPTPMRRGIGGLLRSRSRRSGGG